MTWEIKQSQRGDQIPFGRRRNVLSCRAIHAERGKSRSVSPILMGCWRSNVDDSKCDRIQPCTACSLHQIAGMCQYDLTESERQPILQAEALKEKDKIIAKLSHKLQLLQGHPHIKMEPRDDDLTAQSPQAPHLSSAVPARPTNHRQRRSLSGPLCDSIFFGTPGMRNIVEEVSVSVFFAFSSCIC